MRVEGEQPAVMTVAGIACPALNLAAADRWPTQVNDRATNWADRWLLLAGGRRWTRAARHVHKRPRASETH